MIARGGLALVVLASLAGGACGREPEYDGIGTPFMPVSSVRIISRSVQPVR